MLKKIIGYLSIFAVVAFLILDMLNVLNQGAQISKVVKIERGCSLRCVSDVLHENGVIESKEYFFLLSYFKTMLLKRNLLAGEYIVNVGDSPNEIIDKLLSGVVISHKITIPEGLRLGQIIDLLTSISNLSKDKISLEDYNEGDLFPSTYFYTDDMKIVDVLKMMQSKAADILSDQWAQRDKSIDDVIKTPRQALILASIIEKESLYKDESQDIAAVYLNRLRKGMRLQSCPTVFYAKFLQGNVVKRLWNKDLKIKSDYNTYINVGLPPNPICNPGLNSIKAVLHPSKSSHLYFVAKKDGRHLFAKSYSYHLSNIQQVKKGI